MIHLTRINRVPLVLNPDLIEHFEATPDTVISLTTGEKCLVLESPDTVVERITYFRRSVVGQPLRQMEKTSGTRVPSMAYANKAVPVEGRLCRNEEA